MNDYFLLDLFIALKISGYLKKLKLLHTHHFFIK